MEFFHVSCTTLVWWYCDGIEIFDEVLLNLNQVPKLITWYHYATVQVKPKLSAKICWTYDAVTLYCDC